MVNPDTYIPKQKSCWRNKLNLENVDVAVIGSGPAGLAASIKAKESGAENVLILERSEKLGGLLHQCIHNGFGLEYFDEDMTGPEYGKKFIDTVKDLQIEAKLKTMVTSISPNKEISAVNETDGHFRFTPKSIVLAMGCRERTRQNLGIPGPRPAGIMTAGTAQRYVNVEGYMPGDKIVILGSGDIGLIMARRFGLEGAEVKALVEILPYLGGLIRNQVQCVRDFDIPVLLKHTATRIHGEERVEAVTVSEVDDYLNPIPGTERRIGCNTLITSVGLIPENELSEEAGVEMDPITGAPIVDDFMQTSVPGIFAGGNVLQVHDLVDNVSKESEIAGESAARFTLGEELPRGKIAVKPGRNVRQVVPQMISGERDVTFYMRVTEPEDFVSFKIGNIWTRAELAVSANMVWKEIPAHKFEGLEEGTEEITVDCIKVRE